MIAVNILIETRVESKLLCVLATVTASVVLAMISKGISDTIAAKLLRAKNTTA